jgi:hypothetical protein
MKKTHQSKNGIESLNIGEPAPERMTVSPSILVTPCPRPPTPTLAHKGGGSQTQASGCLSLVPSPLVGEG